MTRKIKKEELESMTYDDIAFMLLKEMGHKMKIQTLFKKICQLLNLSDEEFEAKIGDFFELLSTDKRFIMLENGYWDLRDNHSHKIVLETDEMEAIIDSFDESDYDDEDEEVDEDEALYDSEEQDEDVENELKDLVIISEDDLDSDDEML